MIRYAHCSADNLGPVYLYPTNCVMWMQITVNSLYNWWQAVLLRHTVKTTQFTVLNGDYFCWWQRLERQSSVPWGSLLVSIVYEHPPNANMHTFLYSSIYLPLCIVKQYFPIWWHLSTKLVVLIEATGRFLAILEVISLSRSAHWAKELRFVTLYKAFWNLTKTK